MATNIEKELESKRKDSIERAEKQIVGDVKLLLDGNAAKERDALKKAGLDHHISLIETDKGVQMEREKFENEFKGKVFTIDEIKSVCMKYDLRFSRTEEFKGTIDQMTGIKVKNFLEANGHLGNYPRDNFRVIAPAEMFHTQKRQSQASIRAEADPVLLYKIADHNYLLIHKWGRDFTFMRKLKGLFFQSVFNMIMMTTGMWFVALSIIASLFFKDVVYTTYPGILFQTAVYGALSFVFAIVTIGIGFNEFEKWDHRTTENVWSKVTERRAS